MKIQKLYTWQEERLTDFDNRLEIAVELNHEEISQAVKRRRNGQGQEDDEKDENEPIITRTEMIKVLDIAPASSRQTAWKLTD